MNTDLSIFHLIKEASFVVQFVMVVAVDSIRGIVDVYLFQAQGT